MSNTITLQEGSIRERVYNLFPAEEVPDEVKWITEAAEKLNEPRNKVLAAFQYLVRVGLINRW